MNNSFAVAAMIAALVLAEGAVEACAEQRPAALEPLPVTQVRIEGGFWGPRLETVLSATLPHCFEQCERTGRLANFDRVAAGRTGGHRGYCFDDSDVYKVIEGAAYALLYRRDEQLEAFVDELIGRIAAAQRDDGYLNTYYQLQPDLEPWSNLKDKHELYCAGHLLEAGIAYYQATGKRSLLDVAERFVEYIERVFGPETRHDVPGHEEIELALIKLYRLTGQRRHLELARFFVEQRGRADGRNLYGEYCQDHLPVREQTQIVGHAVRAMYLLSAVTDLQMLDPQAGFDPVLGRVWDDTVNRRLYITGGIGPSAHNEGFTVPYDLPNDTAYCETCAAIALCLWNARLNQLYADARYYDVFERALYNGLLSGISLDGTRFFYTNPLASHGGHHRQPWYACACCPSNIVRFLPSLGGYVYARGPDGLYVNLYVAGTARTEWQGRPLVLRQETRYPWDGRVGLRVEPAEPVELALHVRLPGWCTQPAVRLNGRPVALDDVQRGYLRIARRWQAGDVVELELPMPVVRMQAHPRVLADRGRVALQRGPVVFCLEAADNAVDVRRVALPRQAQIASRFEPELLGGVVTLCGQGLIAAGQRRYDWDQPLYEPAPKAEPAELTWVPYYAWDNRAPGAMVVWLPETLTLVDGPAIDWIRPSASHCYSGDTLTALYDRQVPLGPGQRPPVRFTWWPRRGSVEWVQYDFRQPRRVSRVEVWWFDDSDKQGYCCPPVSWKLLDRAADGWHEVPGVSGYGLATGRFNVVEFEPVTTDGLRIEVQLRAGFSAGLLEWRVR